jgi:hypothetical protein
MSTCRRFAPGGLIPKEHKKIVTVVRLRFVDALRRAQLVREVLEQKRVALRVELARNVVEQGR